MGRQTWLMCLFVSLPYTLRRGSHTLSFTSITLLAWQTTQVSIIHLDTRFFISIRHVTSVFFSSNFPRFGLSCYKNVHLSTVYTTVKYRFFRGSRSTLIQFFPSFVLSSYSLVHVFFLKIYNNLYKFYDYVRTL